MKILILKPSSLGDVVHALPVLRLLKLHFPSGRIYWWIDARLAPLLESDPDLAGVIRFERQRWGNPLHWPEMMRSISELRRHRFDWVIDLQGLFRSGWFAWLAGGGLLAGVEDRREKAFGFYDVSVPRPSATAHAVEWYLQVLSRLNVPVNRPFAWIPENPSAKSSVEKKWNPGASRWIALHPGARWENKRWPAEHYAALVRLLAAEHADLRFVVLGASGDAAMGSRIATACPDRCLDLTGGTTLPELVEWIRLASLMVTNDTGPMHIAAAMGRPVTAVFGPTHPLRTGPFGQTEEVLQHPLPCVPCMKSVCRHAAPLECLRAIAPERVSREVSRRLAGKSVPAVQSV